MALSTKERKLVITLLWACFLINTAVQLEVLASWLSQDNLPRFYRAAFRTCLTLGLYYCLFKGHKWARWLMIFFLSCGVLIGLIYLVSAPSIFLFLYFMFSVGFLMLLLWPKTRIFLHHQRRKRTG